jgi:hypothetical protein
VAAASAPPVRSHDETPDISVTPFSETGEVSRLEFDESETAEALDEGDLEDISSDLLESLPPAADVSWPEHSRPEALEDEPPISSQRPRLASGLEETLAHDGTAPSDEREVPLMTPPPESGPQEAPSPGMASPGVPSVETLLGESVPPQSPSMSLGPTQEQIGESVELEEAGESSLELDMAKSRPQTIPPEEELEALLAPPPSVGVYDAGLMPPPQARDELEEHDRKRAPSGAPAAFEPSGFPSEPETKAFVSSHVEQPYPPAGPEVYSASLPGGGAPDMRLPAPRFRPQTFLELLDTSLSLGHGD